MRTRDADVLAVAVLAIAAAAGVLLLPAGVPRFGCAAVLLLIAPGYAVSAALFPSHGITGAARVALICLLALSMLAVGSVLLDAASVGLSREAWSILFLVLTFGACAVTIDRRRHHPRLHLPLRMPRLRAADVVLVLLALAAVITGIVISRTPLPAKEALGYTQLWMVPVDAAGGNVFRIGVRSAEQRSLAYRLELEVGDVTRVLQSRVVLAPGALLEQQVRLQDPPLETAFGLPVPFGPPAPGVLFGQRNQTETLLPLPAGPFDLPAPEVPSGPQAETVTLLPLPEGASDGIVTARLYRLEEPGAPYRRVTARLLTG